MTTRPCWSGVTSTAKAMNFRSTARLGLAGLDGGGQPIGDGVEALDGPEAQAAVGHADHPRLAELGADLGGQDHAALVVQSVLDGSRRSGSAALPWVTSCFRARKPLSRAAACHRMPLTLHGQPLHPHYVADDRTTTRAARAPAAGRAPPPSTGGPARRSRGGGGGGRSRSGVEGDADGRSATSLRGRRAPAGGSAERAATIAAGSQRPRAAHWNRAAGAGAALEMPTTLRPADRHLTRAQAREAHRGRPRRSARAAPRWTSAATPSSASAAAHASPSQWNARPTSSSHSASPAGTITSTHSTSPGTTSTAPPPLRRRTTSMPAPHRRRGRRDLVLGAAEHEGGRGRRRTPTPPAPAVAGTARAWKVAGRARGAARPRQLTPTGWRGGGRAPSAAGRCRPRRRPRSSRGARSGRRRSTIVVSWRSRSRLRTLQGRHAATTFSQRVLAAAAARHDVVDALRRDAAVLAAVAVAGEHAPAVERRPPPERHLHEVPQPDHRRHRRASRCSECSASPVSWRTSALWPSTSTTARRLGTTHSGS